MSYGRILRGTLSQRRLLLLSLDWGRPKDPPMSLGHASILTHLSRHNIPVLSSPWSVTHSDFSASRVLDFIFEVTSNVPNVDIGIGAFVWNEGHIQTIMRELSSSGFAGRVILGGSQVSYTKKNIERYYPHADVFIRGYAEDALARLMLSRQLQPVIAGVHYAGDFDLGMSAAADLADLASPYLEGVIRPQRFIRWETQRGCPFRCGFCQHRESDFTRKRRPLDQGRIEREIDFFTDNPVIQDIAVLDPVFNSGPHYLDVLRRFLANHYQGKLALQCRIEMVNDEFLDLVERLNHKGVVVLEFGLQTIHRNEERHIQRPNNKKKIERILREVRERRIPCEVSLIYGLPEQTVDSFRQTIDFCKQMGIPTIFAYPLRLHRGTPLYDNKERLRLVESTDEDARLMGLGEDHIGHVVASPSFTKSDWLKMAEIARELDVYNQRDGLDNAIGKMSSTLQHTLWQEQKGGDDAIVAAGVELK